MMLKNLFDSFFSSPLGGTNFCYATARGYKMWASGARAPCGCGYCGKGAPTPVINANTNLRINVISLFDRLLGFNCS